MRTQIATAFLTIAVGGILPLVAQAALHFPTFERAINSPPPLNSAGFSFSFNEFNGNALVGAPSGNSAAYLMDVSTGARLLTLVGPDAGSGEISFGGSVAQIGQNIVVGDYQYDAGSIVRTGSAYIYHGTTGQHLLTIRNPSPQHFDHFSASVQSVGGTLWINSQSTSSSSSGQVYVYNPTNGQLMNTISNPEPGSGNWGFGYKFIERPGSAFISAVGAPVSGVHAGAVYRYDTTTLTQTLKISNPIAQEGASFGWSLAASGSQLLVGAPNTNAGGNNAVGQAYLFDADSGALLRTFTNPEPKDFAVFGRSVELYGPFAIIGAPSADLNPGGSGARNVGAFYVFNTSTGAYLGRVVNPSGGQNDAFTSGWGNEGGLDIIGDRLVVASYLDGAGIAYVYAIPEPSTIAIAIVSLSLIGCATLRRRKYWGRLQANRSL